MRKLAAVVLVLARVVLACEEAECPKPVLELPAGSSGGDGVQQIELGSTVQLDSLGPIIINSDGTTRRIKNWDQMTERERLWTLKRISERNKQRVKALEQSAEKDEKEQKENQT